ncbi:MAG: thymidine kinase [Bacteroidales bacterium]|nr:thymidine kinase [Bacteroidales bacterium]
MHFLENSVDIIPKRGSIEVIAGSMFTGKTEELIRRLKRARIAGLKVEIFKPALDNRYSNNFVVSHDENSISSTPVENAAMILLLSSDEDVIGVDEAQFFDKGIVEVCSTLANKGVRVVVAGLDMDYSGKPFGPMPDLMATAEYVTKVHAICIECGNLANHSYRLAAETKTVLLGEKDIYKPLCRKCFNKQTKK